MVKPKSERKWIKEAAKKTFLKSCALIDKRTKITAINFKEVQYRFLKLCLSRFYVLYVMIFFYSCPMNENMKSHASAHYIWLVWEALLKEGQNFARKVKFKIPKFSAKELVPFSRIRCKIFPVPDFRTSDSHGEASQRWEGEKARVAKKFQRLFL